VTVLMKGARPEQKNYDLAKIGELLAVSFASGLNAFLIGLGYGLLRTASEGMLIIIPLVVGIFAALGAYWGQKNGRIIYTTFVGIIAGVLFVALAAVLAIEFFEMFKN
jgi:putative Mn2+ efflux pump MntP